MELVSYVTVLSACCLLWNGYEQKSLSHSIR